MMEMMKISALAQGLASLLGLGTVSRAEAADMQENERGWSGAKIVRQRVFFTDGTSTTMIFKRTGRKERCAMNLLTEQSQCSPVCYSEDIRSDSDEWMAMEDLGQPKTSHPCSPAWLRKTAESLASIHMANLDRGQNMPWLPAADGAWWQNVVTQLSVDHFQRKMEQEPSFFREFGRYLTELRSAGARFAREMTALCGEKDCLTLTHGDLQWQDGAHVYDCGSVPRIIDFGFCRCAPLYIDLAGWFTTETLRTYYDCASAKGFSLSYADFEERARAAFRYNGFIYLYPSIMDWQGGPMERTGKRLLQALHIILTGDFPERKQQYSNELFQEILRWHCA